MCRARPPGGYVVFVSVDARCAENFCHLGVGHVRQVNNCALLGDDFDQFSHDRALFAGRFDLPSCVSKICRIRCIHMQQATETMAPSPKNQTFEGSCAAITVHMDTNKMNAPTDCIA